MEPEKKRTRRPPGSVRAEHRRLAESTIVSWDLGFINLPYARLVVDERHPLRVRIVDWKRINLGTTSIREAVPRLREVLDRLDFARSDIMIIETQERSNSDMLQLGAAMHMYFLWRGNEVRFVSARGKLKVYEPSPAVDRSAAPLPTEARTYPERKNLAERHLTRLFGLYDNPALPDDVREQVRPYIEWFARLKKKDDPADCLLQGIHFMRKHLRESRGDPDQMTLMPFFNVLTPEELRASPPPHHAHANPEKEETEAQLAENNCLLGLPSTRRTKKS